MAFMVAQCAVVNYGQYFLATLLLHSRLKGVKLLRIAVGAPDDAEACATINNQKEYFNSPSSIAA